MKRIGIDIGGTFTDIVMIDEVSGNLTHDKVPSTPHDPSEAVLNYFREYQGSFGDVRFIMHGTTVATNAVIEGKGARVGLITTVGHQDRLDIQRTNLEILYDLNYSKPVALVPWEFRREVAGRTLSDGTILTPLDEIEVLEAAQDLIENNAVEVICVCFINSYANPKQEQQVKEIIKQKYPKFPLLTSSETLAEFLEYERFSTTVVSAFLMPEMDKYLRRLEEFFAEKGLPKERFMLMQGNGGVTGSFLARQNAALTVESGPAGGIVASQYIGSLKGEKNLITFDMGGTSTDVCLIRDGEPHITVDYKVAGHAMRFPLIDIISIGAGGGSVAWIDEGGGLHVGPQSSGANPGPACYGVGGEEPTVSDAHAVLGRLSPEILLGNRIKIKLGLAEKACDKVASKYNISIVDAAKAIIKIANENMFNALRVISTERGVDPTNFTLIAYGGAGPMHSGMMMKKMKMNKCIIPPIPGNHSSLGLISADIKHDYVQSILRPTSGLDIEWIHEIYRSLEQKAKEALRAEQISGEKAFLERRCDMRYIGQAYIPCIIPFASYVQKEEQLAETERIFHKTHMNLYKHSTEGEPTEIVSLRLSAVGKQERPKLVKAQGEMIEPTVTTKTIYFEDIDKFVECNTYKRQELPVGFNINGPAMIYQMDTTTLIYTNQLATVDEYGNLIVQEKLR